MGGSDSSVVKVGNTNVSAAAAGNGPRSFNGFKNRRSESAHLRYRCSASDFPKEKSVKL